MWCSSARSKVLSSGAVFLSVAVFACSSYKDGPTAPAAFAAKATGRAERGLTLALSATRGTATVAASAVTWSANPSANVKLDSIGATLLDTGAVVLTATSGSDTASVTVRVATPPTILVDMRDVSGGTLGNRDVYRMTLDGAALTRLTSGTADNFQPSAYAGTVTFASFRTGNESLYQVPLTGGTETSLDSLPYPTAEPAAGGQLAFTTAATGVNKLWMASSTGQAPLPLTSAYGSSGTDEENPTWSPDGHAVVFVTTQYGNAALVKLDLTTGKETQLTSGVTTDVDPSWSPDGTTIAFASTRDGDNGIFLLTLATDSVTRLSPSNANDGEPVWLADGRLVYATWNTSGVGQIKWADPAAPAVIHTVPTPSMTDPEHPTVPR